MTNLLDTRTGSLLRDLDPARTPAHLVARTLAMVLAQARS